jgi:hypothetical protein
MPSTVKQIGEFSFKAVTILIAALLLVMSQGLRKVAAGDDDEGIPLRALAGKYADTAHGSFALCLDPTNNFAEVSCASTKAVVFPQTTVDVGNETDDTKGNSCETYTETDTDLPPDLSPPFVAVFHDVAKITSYDRATGSGDGTFTNYSGGNCVGAVFNKGSATVASSGTFHFVVAEGKRIDFLLTSLTDPIGGVGDFSFSGTNLRQ